MSFLFLQGRLLQRDNETPIFLKFDAIANAHKTSINVVTKSKIKPDSLQTEILKKGYGNIWAHLNYLFETNDVAAGKEYYTEDWFKQINHHYSGLVKTNVKRNDIQHELQIENWDPDGLLCTAIDSNVSLRYHYPNNVLKNTKATIAVVLLYQGDHWRLDALRVISEIATP